MTQRKVFDIWTTVSKTGVLNMGKFKLGGMENRKVHLMIYTESNPMVIAKPVAGVQQSGRLTKERDNDPMPCTNCQEKCKQDMECDLFIDWLARQEPVAGGR
ncbi:MAG: hypothetical protein M0R06_10360 [Sphaerochaeta sp.]|jgi:hypothetical protein|nr:hypothetical protein [Sphaerochaeta sp.]